MVPLSSTCSTFCLLLFVAVVFQFRQHCFSYGARNKESHMLIVSSNIVLATLMSANAVRLQGLCGLSVW